LNGHHGILRHTGFGNLELVYFGALYVITGGWSSLAARDRKARFRILPIVWTGLLATALVPVWPYSRPYCVAVAALIAMGVQLVSPWSQSASRYARYLRASEKQERKVKTA